MEELERKVGYVATCPKCGQKDKVWQTCIDKRRTLLDLEDDVWFADKEATKELWRHNCPHCKRRVKIQKRRKGPSNRRRKR